MKKKGLIISTVVMVVVLIASLTTATYAWFSQSATSKVEDISFSVGAASSVVIGVGKGTNETTYHSGDGLTYAAGDWTGGDPMLGTLIDAGLALNVTAGVGSSADQSKMDQTYIRPEDPTELRKASGTDIDSLGELSEVAINTATSDVIDLKMGIRPTKAETVSTVGIISIVIPSTQTYIGMAAALRFEIKVGEKEYGYKADGGDIFGDTHFSTQAATADNRIDDGGNHKFVFYFMIDEGDAAITDITEFSIRLFVSGYDEDCVNDATGTEATIMIQFDGYKAGESIDNVQGHNANWQQLTLEAAGA